MSIFYSFPQKFGKTFTISRRRPADKQFSENYNFTVQNDSDYCGDMVYVAYRDLIIDEGITVTTDNPCKGLYIYVDGDCTINGILSMTARGAKFDPSGVDAPCRPRCEAFLNITFSYPYTAEQLEDYIRRYIQSIAENGMPQAVWPSYLINNIYQIPANEEDLATIPAVGGAGGDGGTISPSSPNGKAGTNGTNRKSGGGGGGGAQSTGGIGGNGGNGTAYSGGAGGGGGTSGAAEAGSSIGGKGGNARGGTSGQSGGGAGNPGGTKAGSGTGGSDGETGTGGLIILVVRGNLTIGANGKIESQGKKGGTGHTNYGAAGGSSGGGSINIFYGGIYTKTGQVIANGGDSVTVGRPGGKGGDGCITETEI